MMNARAIEAMIVAALFFVACDSKKGAGTVGDGAIEHGAGTGGGPGAGGSGGATGGSGGIGAGGGGAGGQVSGGGSTGTATGGGGSIGSGGAAMGGRGGTGSGGTGGSIDAGDKGGAMNGGNSGRGGSGGQGGSGMGGTGIDGGAVKDGGPALEGGIDTSKDAAMDADANTDSGPVECESSLGGTCTTMANGCAECPTGSYAHPTRAGCDERYEWCCTKTAPSANDCTNGGGVCIANGAEYPDKWIKMRTSCGTDPNLYCYMPVADECPAFPQKCVDIGGVCTPVRWGSCPVGMEIYALGTDQFGCENNWMGWCCVDAPPSPCSDSQAGVCVPGECTGCFAPVSDTSMTCEAGRSCCRDRCD
jgi:hypothetical protein